MDFEVPRKELLRRGVNRSSLEIVTGVDALLIKVDDGVPYDVIHIHQVVFALKCSLNIL